MFLVDVETETIPQKLFYVDIKSTVQPPPVSVWKSVSLYSVLGLTTLLLVFYVARSVYRHFWTPADDNRQLLAPSETFSSVLHEETAMSYESLP
ncbi:hypothetical protein AAVH_14610 [Aphelenchoides avenae]|nr:hypothetical protein AAVH_14610 [Aphelenchus avenae]